MIVEISKTSEKIKKAIKYKKALNLIHFIMFFRQLYYLMHNQKIILKKSNFYR